MLKKETICSGKNMEAVTTVTFNKEINSARSQRLFITASQSESKSSRDYSSCHAYHISEYLRHKCFKGGIQVGTQCTVGLGMPQLIPQYNVALFGSADFLDGSPWCCVKMSQVSWLWGGAVWHILLHLKGCLYEVGPWQTWSHRRGLLIRAWSCGTAKLPPEMCFTELMEALFQDSCAGVVGGAWSIIKNSCSLGKPQARDSACKSCCVIAI